jgi:hypothetical protein
VPSMETAAAFVAEHAARPSVQVPDIATRRVLLVSARTLDVAGLPAEHTARTRSAHSAASSGQAVAKEGVGLGMPCTVVEGGAVQEDDGRGIGGAASPVADRRVGACEVMAVELGHGFPRALAGGPAT